MAVQLIERRCHVGYSVIMIRTQIQLTEAQFEALKVQAADQGRSMADMIRACVDEALPKVGRRDPAERKQRALAAIGSLGKGPADLSTAHDTHLAEAYR